MSPRRKAYGELVDELEKDAHFGSYQGDGFRVHDMCPMQRHGECMHPVGPECCKVIPDKGCPLRTDAFELRLSLERQDDVREGKI